jgi:hypothetical protein
LHAGRQKPLSGKLPSPHANLDDLLAITLVSLTLEEKVFGTARE